MIRRSISRASRAIGWMALALLALPASSSMAGATAARDAAAEGTAQGLVGTPSKEYAAEESIRKGVLEAWAAMREGESPVSPEGPRLAPVAAAVEELLAREGGAWTIPHDLERGAHLGAGTDACGAPGMIAKTLLCPGRVDRSVVYYLHDPASGEYSAGGWLDAGTRVEALARRIDGFIALAREDGRVELVREGAIVLEPAASAGEIQRAVPPAWMPWSLRSPAPDDYTYEKVTTGGAVVHIVRAPLTSLALTGSLAPFYDALHPGHDRTLPVDRLAAMVSARVAVNGTFFIDASSEPQYGYPLACVITGGALAWDVTSPELLRRHRCYAAFTSARHVVLGDTVLTGREILSRNAAGAFDAARFGDEKIRSLMGGLGWLVKDGDPDAWRTYAGTQFDPSFYALSARRARTLLGVDATREHLVLVAQEEGTASPHPMSLPELAPWMVRTLDVRDAVFLDGGGSTQMVIEGRTVTSPSDGTYRRNSTALTLVGD